MECGVQKKRREKLNNNRLPLAYPFRLRSIQSQSIRIMETLNSQSEACLASDAHTPAPIGSHGLRKRIRPKGISWQTPFPGDELQGTRYISTLFFPHLALRILWKDESVFSDFFLLLRCSSVHYRGRVEGGQSLDSSGTTPFNFKPGQCKKITRLRCFFFP